MKYAIPEISWHNRDPVLSVDFQPKSANGELKRLATGGTDSHVVIWYISTTDTGSVSLEVASDLTRHQKAVNAVRWSPNGEFLASGDDESIIFVWKQKTEEPVPVEGEEQYKETWVIHKTLRGHMEDVLDISWSANSLHLASGSVDNKLLLWDVMRGKYTNILADHKGFVQGVAWDPRGQLLATASSDRIFRTFDLSSKKVISRSSKATLPFQSGHPLHDVTVRLYHDDTLQTYYRRLSFSPDGLLIAVPAGKIEPEQGKLDMKPINAVYIYTRHSLKVPACVIPCGEAALVTRWSPRLYSPRSTGPPPAIPSPHRMILAVATKRSVLIYDTQQKTPIAIISNIHYTRLTDLSWSSDGRTLVASSTDGFCSVIMFGEDELGEVLPEPVIAVADDKPEPMEIQDDSPAKEEKEEKNNKTTPPKAETKISKPESKSTKKIDSFMKFKAPTEKSPNKIAIRRKKNEPQQKTPVKLDLLVDTAMPSWSDNSNSEVEKPVKEMKVKQPVEIMVIDDSEDSIKLVYEESTQEKPDLKDESPQNKSKSKDDQDKGESKDNPKKSESNEPKKNESKDDPKKRESKDDQNKIESKDQDKSESKEETANSSPERKRTSPKVTTPSSRDNNFLKQAKVTDVKEPAVKAVPSPKAPRRVNFVTLSSPKNKKKC